MTPKTIRDDRTGLLFDLGPQSEPEPLVARPHPIWTKNKSALIARYLRYFVYITKHGTYIDGMSGPQYLDRLDFWSARLVLENKPQWLRHFYLYEKSARSFALLEQMAAAHSRPSNHTIDVMQGDCNRLIPQLLASRSIRDAEAAFCLLDQRTFECDWKTVVTLADYKPANRNKIELFYFLPNAWLDRAIAAVRDPELLQRWWGRDDWSCLRGMKSHDRARFVAERFRSELGYASAMAWPVWSHAVGRKLMYFMIHATDHPQAPQLMARAYRKAVDPEETPEQLELLDWKNLPDEELPPAATRDPG